MGGSAISKTTDQKDLGVIVDNNLKFSKQCFDASKKSYQDSRIYFANI